MTARKAFMSAGGLFMMLIVMLGVLGIVNGLWSKNLVVEGTVTTGDLNADWDCGWTNDDGVGGSEGTIQGSHGCDQSAAATVEPFGDDGADPHGSFDFPYSEPFVEKDVGECTLEIDPDEVNGGEDFGDQVAAVTIVNAYPSYECTITLWLSNTGSIPFNITGSVLSDVSDLPIELLNGACEFDLEDPQVDPGNEKQLECTVHVLQEAEQNVCSGTTTYPGAPDGTSLPTVDHNCTSTSVQYDFDIKVCVAQWNESATYGECTSSSEHEGPGTNDFDGDGVPNAVDNCPIDPNPGNPQEDVDGDGVGTVCDPDDLNPQVP